MGIMCYCSDVPVQRILETLKKGEKKKHRRSVANYTDTWLDTGLQANK